MWVKILWVHLWCTEESQSHSRVPEFFQSFCPLFNNVLWVLGVGCFVNNEGLCREEKEGRNVIIKFNFKNIFNLNIKFSSFWGDFTHMYTMKNSVKVEHICSYMCTHRHTKIRIHLKIENTSWRINDNKGKMSKGRIK